MSNRVLIIDDEDLFREDLAGILRKKGLECDTAASAHEGLEAVRETRPDVVLCDVRMPGTSGLAVLDNILEICPSAKVIMITAYGDLETAVSAFRKGACDYVLKPLVIEDVLAKVRRLIELKSLGEEVKTLRRQLSEGTGNLPLLGDSEPMQHVLSLVDDVAPTRSTVLISGESGTGKEVIARALHMRGPTPAQPFLGINCAGIHENLLESELFGHVRGAFTGAIKDHTGRFEAAGEGTILLDEISEMPLPLQAKLLRVLEQKEFVPIGGTKPRRLQARVIGTTNRDLRAFVEEGQFREDLYFRIAVFEIHVPPLRERRMDIPTLANHFVDMFNRELRRHCEGIKPAALQALLEYGWPGNVRELRNVMERAIIVSRDTHISLDDLPPVIAGLVQDSSPSNDLKSAVLSYERQLILHAIQECGGNKEEAARKLGVNPSTLYRKLSETPVRAGESAS